MLQEWAKDGKSGRVVFPKGEVVYQHEPHVRIEPIYMTSDEKYYIEIDGHLSETPQNPFNGYCYRQDGE